jgi:glucose-6-phosphate isomerase
MVLVSAIGEFLQINTYNQPGVEKGKAILKESLQN